MPVNQIQLMRFKSDEPVDQTKNRLKKLFKSAGLDRVIQAGDITAIKIHFGEKGNVTHVPAAYVEPIVRMIKSCGARTFLTDTTVLYKSVRQNAIDHLQLAYDNGFTYEKVGAPVIIADGIIGRNETEIEVSAPLNKTVSLATELVAANSIITITHVTGHLSTGLGATIKNLGMGMSSRRGKLAQHSVSKPIIKSNKCTACGLCMKWCPANAIEIPDKFAIIDQNICIGCGECLTVCRFDAVHFKWNNSSTRLQQQIAEHALGIVRQKNGRIGYLTFLTNMTKDCDCLPGKQVPIAPDIGVLAGFDPVAIDQAVIDLTNQVNDQNIAQLAHPEIDYSIQLDYGEKIGLGCRKYQLIETEF